MGRQLLIDFLTEKGFTNLDLQRGLIDSIIEYYKSIDKASSESRIINEHECEKELCPKCGGTGMFESQSGFGWPCECSWRK